MSVIVRKDLTIIFSSDPLTGAQNLSADLSSFSVALNSPLKIPSSAISCDLAVIGANIWNDAANISPFYNNNSVWIKKGATHILVPDLQEGLYSLDNVQSYIAASLVNLGYPRDLITLTADNATARVVITIRYTGDGWDFSQPNSIGSILGFLPSRVLVATVDNQSFYGDVPASFNRVNSWLITSDIISNGVPINQNGRGIIGAVPIQAPPNNESIYDPQNPVWIDATELIGMSKQNFNFQLRDQSLRTVSTNEIYTFTVCIRYGILMTNQTVPLKP